MKLTTSVCSVKPLEPEWIGPQTELPRGKVRFMFRPSHNNDSASLRPVCGKRLSSWAVGASVGDFMQLSISL